LTTRVPALLACASALLALGAALAERQAPSLRVLAAASLTEVVEALAARFEGARVVTSFGASSELARQIADGAPADVFLSASPEWIEFLRERKRLDGAPVVVARNRLVCVAPRGSPLVGGASDPRALLGRLAEGDLVAIADAGAPAGEYARQALAQLGLLEAYGARLVGQKDVRAVLHLVEQGEVAAGFVYETDAKIASVERLFAFDPASHPPIEYRAAALRFASSPAEARRFVAFLREPAARRLLAEAGFALP
jgi:molybdate transport system substrate-binding protein